MVDPQVTIIVVPRERFSVAEQSLASIYEHTPQQQFRLVFVDAGSPRQISRRLEILAREKGFRLIRTEHYLTPNQARNLALGEVNTRYVVFIDNDVIVSEGWLAALVGCAEETGAWVVGPLCLEGTPARLMVHGRGRTARIAEQDGRRGYYEGLLGREMSFAESHGAFCREPCELVEYHCVLIRTDVFAQLNLCDEKLLGVLEHHDACLTVRQAGGSIYFEPRSVVRYVSPESVAFADAEFFALRWNEAWIAASINYFRRK